MKISKIIAVVGMVAFSSSSYALDEWTAARAIGSVEINTAAGTTYVISSPAGWGSATCPNATYITLNKTDVAYKEELAQILTAKAGGLNIEVYGACDTTGVYFSVKQLRLK